MGVALPGGEQGTPSCAAERRDDRKESGVQPRFSPKEMEYLQTLRWSLEDVARVYGVPKAMLGDIERVPFANFATARRVFWEDTLVPQMAFYAEALQQMLLPNFDDPSLFVEFDTSEVEALQENESDKATRRKTYVSGGIMTVNEVRQEMNLRPVPWGDGPSESGGSSGA